MNQETPIQKAWSSLKISLPKTNYVERGDKFLKFDFEGKKYKVEIKEEK